MFSWRILIISSDGPEINLDIFAETKEEALAKAENILPDQQLYNIVYVVEQRPEILSEAAKLQLAGYQQMTDKFQELIEKLNS